MTTTANFETEELTLSAYLSATGHLVTTVRQCPGSPGRALAIFTDSPALRADIVTYWTGRGRVEPQSFNRALREIRHRFNAVAGRLDRGAAR